MIHGVGLNDANYKTVIYGYCLENGVNKYKRIWICPYFVRWSHMIKRCYSEKYLKTRNSYKGCSVCEEWLTFSNFKSWMEKQDWEGKELDKDILVKGNKIYSPETCVFVSPLVNSFITDSAAIRGNCSIGVSYHKRDKKFQAQCMNPFTKKSEFLGNYDSDKEAHKAWLKRKTELAKELADKECNSIVAKALIERYQNFASM